MISIIIPTLNEAENLENLFKRIKNLNLKKYEIIINDGGSEDNTPEIAKKLSADYKLPVRILDSSGKDLSNSILSALEISRGNLIVVMDADLQHPPEKIPEMIKILENGKDIVIASRFVKGAKCELTPVRLFLSKAFIFLSHIFVPKAIPIKDSSSGYFAFKKEILNKITLSPIGFKILLEILAKANYEKVVEIPFHFKNRNKGESKLDFKQILIMLGHLIKLGLYNKEHIRFLKFATVGFTGIIVNEGLLWLLTEYAKLHYLLSGIIAIETSIISNFILNDIWTFKNERSGKFYMRLIKFNISRLLSFIVNFLTLFLLTSIGIHYLISNLIGIILATIVSYLTGLWWVWKK